MLLFEAFGMLFRKWINKRIKECYAMKIKTMFLMGLMLSLPIMSFAQQVYVTEVHGVVKVRRDVKEEWIPAYKNMFLKRTDTILSERDSWAKLVIDGKTYFVLPQEAMLEVSDLKEISKEKLFLLLMAQKVAGLRSGEKDTRTYPLAIPRGRLGRKGKFYQPDPVATKCLLRRFNGAKALYDNELFTNAVLAFRRVLSDKENSASPWGDDSLFYLAKSFEKLAWYGRALEVYSDLLSLYPENDFKHEIQQSIKRLKKREE